MHEITFMINEGIILPVVVFKEALEGNIYVRLNLERKNETFILGTLNYAGLSLGGILFCIRRFHFYFPSIFMNFGINISILFIEWDLAQLFCFLYLQALLSRAVLNC